MRPGPRFERHLGPRKEVPGIRIILCFNSSYLLLSKFATRDDRQRSGPLEAFPRDPLNFLR
jgi:hypothetical protein